MATRKAVCVILLLQLFGLSQANYFLKDKATVLKTCGVCASVIAASCMQVISTGDECLVECLGKYSRSLGPGLHFIARPFEKISFRDTLKEQILDVPPQECFTADNAQLTADAIVYMKITNMNDACYKVFNVRSAVHNLCLAHLRTEIGHLTLEESFSARGELNKALLTSLNIVCQDWGIEITRVEIQHLEPSYDIKIALESQISADRKKRATILESEGERMKLINEAEGNAQALVTDAEARKQSIILASHAEAERQEKEAAGLRMAIETLTNTIAVDGKPRAEAIKESLQFLGLVRYLETQGKFAASANTKVLLFPSSQDNLPLNMHSILQ